MHSQGIGLSSSRDIINLRLSHHNASIKLLETCRLECDKSTLSELKKIEGVDECVLLKTCNRVEIIALGSESAVEPLREYWYSRSSGSAEEMTENLIAETSTRALEHLLRLAAGLDSMVVGEEQILGQIQGAYEVARENQAAGVAMDLLLYKILTRGREIRRTTGIGVGSVSIGSIAVKLLEENLGELDNRNVGIVGAGEIAHLVCRHLVHGNKPNIYIANRTMERATELAEEIHGTTLTLGKVGEMLVYAEAVIVATSAPHPVISREMAMAALEKKPESENLLIVDLSQPRNVAREVGELPHVTLYNIDDLREISRKNLEARRESAQQAERIIQIEVQAIESVLKRETVEPLITEICCKADEVRRRELDKTLSILKDLDENQRKVVEKLSQVLVSRILHSPIETLRNSATIDDVSVILAAQKLFKLETGEAQ